METAALANIVSGGLMAALGALLLAANVRHQHNRIFAILAIFWGAQILTANAVRITTSAEAARLAGELSLAFLLPLYFFVIMFASIFPRPRAPFGTSGVAVLALLAPAAVALGILFLRPEWILQGVEPQAAGFTMRWGPAVPILAAGLYGAFFYALFVMMRRLGEAESPIERKQVTAVLAALAMFVAYNVPAQLVLFGRGAATEAASGDALLIALVMLVGLALLVVLAVRVRRQAALLGAILGCAALGFASPLVDLLGIVRIASVALIVYAIARYQLFDVDIRVKHAAATAAAGVALAATGAATWLVLRRTTLPDIWSGGLAVGVVLLATIPALRVSYRVADRVAPAVSREGDHLYLRKLEVYRAAVESVLREGRDARVDDEWLAQTRARLALSEREHAVVVSLATAGASDALRASPEVAVGSVVFGKYVIERVVGEGGYGRAFLARDRILGRAVVIKELLARWRGDPRVVRTFLHEARIAGELDHPNIVAVYAVESHGQDHYIIMEHVPGGTLAERMGDGKLPPAEAIRIARGILDALAAAHAKGVVHRDVKPSNILLTAKGDAKLADFGIAQVTASEPQRTVSGLTTGDFHPGTLQYMSPEQARGLPLDARSDIYAVGALLHRMVLGRPHVDVSRLDEFTARNAIASAEAPAPTGIAWLDAALARALAPEASARFTTARQFAEALPLNPPVEAHSSPP